MAEWLLDTCERDRRSFIFINGCNLGNILDGHMVWGCVFCCLDALIEIWLVFFVVYMR